MPRPHLERGAIMVKVFISHRWAEGEHDFARDLKKKLESYEDITVLLDEYEMLPGDSIKDWMDDAIQKGCDVFLFVLSPHSLQSENCLYELDLALQTGLPIIPVFIRDCEIPENLRGILFADFRENLDLPFYLVNRLVRGIRRQAERFQQNRPQTHIDDSAGKSVKITQDAPPSEITGKDGARMVLIPAGEFQMGSDDGEENEKPVHPVYLDAFYMDVYEVTNAQYALFLNEYWKNPAMAERELLKINSSYCLIERSGHIYKPKAGYENHPVIEVSWYGAAAYAQFYGKRLPTEAQWEKAARGKLEGRKYPCGDDIDSTKANYNHDESRGVKDVLKHLKPVGNFPANGYGLYDMAGNVREWCADEYHSGYYSRGEWDNPKGPGQG